MNLRSRLTICWRVDSVKKRNRQARQPWRNVIYNNTIINYSPASSCTLHQVHRMEQSISGYLRLHHVVIRLCIFIPWYCMPELFRGGYKKIQKSEWHIWRQYGVCGVQIQIPIEVGTSKMSPPNQSKSRWRRWGWWTWRCRQTKTGGGWRRDDPLAFPGFQDWSVSTSNILHFNMQMSMYRTCYKSSECVVLGTLLFLLWLIIISMFISDQPLSRCLAASAEVKYITYIHGYHRAIPFWSALFSTWFS